MNTNNYQLIMLAADFTNHAETDIPEYVLEQFPYYIQNYGIYVINSNSKWFNVTWTQISKRVNESTEHLQELRQRLVNRSKRYQYITGWNAPEFTEMFYSGMCNEFDDMPLVIMVAVICDELKRRGEY